MSAARGSQRPVTVLSVRGVRAAHGRIEVLHGVDLDAAAGEVVALLGPNGAGRSTLLAVVAGLHRPTSGEVLLGGRRVTGARVGDLARAGVCLVPERRGVFAALSVAEHLRLTATGAGIPVAAVEAEVYDRFPSLAAHHDRPAGCLSGGQQQVLAVARAVACRPALLLLDELSMGVAPRVLDQLHEQVRRVAASGAAVVVVEQFARHALGVADRAVVLVGGRTVLAGTPAEVATGLLDAYLGAVP
jgi:branched-chain amino acid transport system ATP-binding protein